MKNRIGLMAVLALFLCASISYGQTNYVKRINCGKASGDTTYDSKTFSPDDPVNQGFEYTGDNKTTNGHGNFTLGSVFEPTRYTQLSSMTYEFPVDDGTYRVILYLAEPYHGPDLNGSSGPDHRKFDIDIENGQHTETELSVYQAAGGSKNMIYVIDEEVNVTDDKVTITFSEGSSNDPIISAIEVLGVAPSTIPVTSITLNPTNASIDITADQQLTATVLPSNASDPTVQWSSSTTAVATVSATGLVTPLTVGTTTITATSSDPNITATAVIEVTDQNNPPTGGNWSLSGDNAYRLNGNVGIGTANPVPTNGDPNYKLAVNGSVRAKEVKVETGWADYVFFKDYKLPTLEEVQKHIEDKGHLINIPSAAEVEANGIELGEMNKLLLEKIEELTLYVIQQEKVQKELEERIKSLERE